MNASVQEAERGMMTRSSGPIGKNSGSTHHVIPKTEKMLVKVNLDLVKKKKKRLISGTAARSSMEVRLKSIPVASYLRKYEQHESMRKSFHNLLYKVCGAEENKRWTGMAALVCYQTLPECFGN